LIAAVHSEYLCCDTELEGVDPVRESYRDILQHSTSMAVTRCSVTVLPLTFRAPGGHH
jgi:hypothetical protein